MSSKEHLSAAEGQTVSSLKKVQRSREILRTMAGTSALIAALVAPNVFAAPCSAEKEDFINYVTGGNECLALEVLSGEALKKPGSHLLVHVHGDSSGDILIKKGSLNRNVLKENIPEDSKDVAVIQIIRPGYRTDYDNSIPGGYSFPYKLGEHPVRSSTGIIFKNGIDSYTKENIEAVMHAAFRLKEHYKPKMVTMAGQSGGASMILSGSALFPQYAPNTLILTGAPCNLESEAAYHKFKPSPSSISPYTVIEKMPKQVKVVALTGENDEKTPPPRMQECVDKLKGAGINTTFIIPYAGHGNIARTPEYRAALMAVLESKPPTIVAQTPSSGSSGLISTSAQMPAK